MSATQKISIVARLRPRITGESEDDSVKVVRNNGSSFISVVNPRDPTQVFKFPFTNCYDESSKQEEIFVNDVHPMVDVVYRGITVTIFAYGVTSSGKTHTMQGSITEPGVIPRTVEAVLSKRIELIAHTSDMSSSDISICMSYMEIYKDEVYDLLVTRENAPKLPVREDGQGKVFVANLTYETITTFGEFEAIYTRATKHRSVGATNLNRASSRSHAILTIRATILDRAHNKSLTGTINLVDLAGSENNKLTGNDPSRMAESAAINKSLSVLGQVVHALNSNQPRIPYRNSKLTRILQDALGGSSIGLLICNLAPGAKFRQDTLNTLNFAVRTKNIENKPVVNEQDHRKAPKPINPTLPPQARGTQNKQASNSVGFSGQNKPNGRQSLVPVARIPRTSAIGNGGHGFQPFAFPSAQHGLVKQEQHPSSLGLTLTESEFNEKVAKAVEAEVAKRMEELERQRQEEKQRQEQELELRQARSSQINPYSIDNRDVEEENHSHRRTKSRSPKKEQQSLPSGILTPVLKRHKDLDEEVRSRLQELEKKFERGGKDAPHILSPVSKKKIGRAYVAAARSYSEKGDLQAALDLYRKAETYVPDNIKLKERIIEIEWAVKNNRPFAPSPKPKKKSKSQSKRKQSSESNTDMAMDVDENSNIDDNGNRRSHRQLAIKRGAVNGDFGAEVTNSPANHKRSRGSEENDDLETPVKRLRRSGRTKNPAVIVIESDEDDIPQAPVKDQFKAVSAT